MTWPGRPRPLALLRDGVLSARAQPAATLTAALVVAMVCVVVLVTTGRVAATEREVMAQIDDVGTRLVVVTDASGGAGIRMTTVDEVARMAGVTWAFGLGPARDVHNPTLGGGTVGSPMRSLVGDLPPQVEVVEGRGLRAAGEALVGARARSALALVELGGGVGDDAGEVGVVGAFTAPGPLSSLEDAVLVMPGADEDVPVRYLYVLVDEASHAPHVARGVEALLDAVAPDQVEVSVAEGALGLREVVAGTLGAGGRQLMAGVLGVGLVLVTVTVLGAVAGRRRDFGRRRALGATRSAIVVLVLVQTATAAVPGALVGTAAGLVGVHLLAGGVPSATFVVGVAVLAVVVALVGSVPPAITAARRDPVRILRVP